MLEELLELSSDDGLRPLTDWEIDRVEEWSRKPRGTLSEKQTAKVREIYRECVG